MRSKKADMPFWMILMLLALFFLLVVIVVSGGFFRGFVKDMFNFRSTVKPADCLIEYSGGQDSNDNKYDDVAIYTVDDQNFCCDPKAKLPDKKSKNCDLIK